MDQNIPQINHIILIQIGIIICGGLYQISMGERNDFLKDPNPETPSIGRVATAFYSGLW